MSSPQTSVKNTLKKYQIQPSKRLGQHFLIDKFALGKVVSASDLKPLDVVLEIGPGTGILTRELTEKAGKVVAIEKDARMLEILKKAIKEFDNVKIIHGDILKVNPVPYTLYPYKVVANLPFYLTAPVIRKFLECNEARPRYMVLVVQKEVAQRICAKPPRMNLLAVSVQFYAEPKIISYIPKKAFWPQPKVDSAIVKIIPYKTAPPFKARAARREQFFEIVRAGFAHPRKQLVTNLSRGLKLSRQGTVNWLLQSKIKPEQRAETLSVENWIALAKSRIIK